MTLGLLALLGPSPSVAEEPVYPEAPMPVIEFGYDHGGRTRAVLVLGILGLVSAPADLDAVAPAVVIGLPIEG